MNAITLTYTLACTGPGCGETATQTCATLPRIAQPQPEIPVGWEWRETGGGQTSLLCPVCLDPPADED